MREREIEIERTVRVHLHLPCKQELGFRFNEARRNELSNEDFYWELTLNWRAGGNGLVFLGFTTCLLWIDFFLVISSLTFGKVREFLGFYFYVELEILFRSIDVWGFLLEFLWILCRSVLRGVLAVDFRWWIRYLGLLIFVVFLGVKAANFGGFCCLRSWKVWPCSLFLFMILVLICCLMCLLVVWLEI